MFTGKKYNISFDKTLNVTEIKLKLLNYFMERVHERSEVEGCHKIILEVFNLCKKTEKFLKKIY